MLVDEIDIKDPAVCVISHVDCTTRMCPNCFRYAWEFYDWVLWLPSGSMCRPCFESKFPNIILTKRLF